MKKPKTIAAASAQAKRLEKERAYIADQVRRAGMTLAELLEDNLKRCKEVPHD